MVVCAARITATAITATTTEPWLINGWQSYAKYNRHPGFGGQILWIPSDSLKLVFNSYTTGQDNLQCQANSNNGQGTMNMPCQPQNGGNPNAAAGSYVGAGPPVNYANVTRVHEDDSLLVKYYDAHGQGGAGISKMAFSLTWESDHARNRRGRRRHGEVLGLTNRRGRADMRARAWRI